MLSEPLVRVKLEITNKRRKQDGSPAIKKNWVDVSCLKKQIRELRNEVFKYDKLGVMSKD